MQNHQNLVFLKDNQPITTSRLVATKFVKTHAHVLRDIENLECSANFRESNFGLSQYEQKMPTGGIKKQPEYHITKNGFVFLVMGFTGKEAARFKEEYIEAFDKMYAQLYHKKSEKVPSADDLFYQKFRELSKKLDDHITVTQAKTIKVLEENVIILKEMLAKADTFARVSLRIEISELNEQIRTLKKAKESALSLMNEATRQLDNEQPTKASDRKRITFSKSERVTISDMKK